MSLEIKIFFIEISLKKAMLLTKYSSHHGIAAGYFAHNEHRQKQYQKTV